MKRLAIVALLLISFGVGAYSFTQITEKRAIHEQLQTQITSVQDEIKIYEESMASLKIAQISTNTELVSKILDTDVIRLLSITALTKDASGNYATVISVNNIDDVAFFTNTISAIEICAKYTNFNKTYDYLSSLEYPYVSVSFDTENKTATLMLMPANVGTSDIDSEFTVEPTPIDEQPEATTETAPQSDDAQNVPEIQYLGGDTDAT